jgi:type IV pilus assembly protein PilC
MELYLVLSAGIPLSEGVGMLAESERDRGAASVLSEIGGELDTGGDLHTALRESGAFPPYMTDMLEIGGLTGRTDTVLKSLSAYYEQQDRLSASIRSAVVYPSVLLVMLRVVLVIRITRVLPIFSDVFGQLGSNLSGAALVTLRAGIWLRGHWLPVVLTPAGLWC